MATQLNTIPQTRSAGIVVARPAASHIRVWEAIAPVVVAAVLALLPAPPGLPHFAWLYFSIFAGVIVGLILEPLPGAAIALIGLTLVTTLAPFVLFSAQQATKTGFHPAGAALAWALSGYSNPYRVAHLRRVRTCSWLQPNGTWPPHRSNDREADGQEYSPAGIRNRISRYDARAVYTVPDRTKRRHYLSDRERSRTGL